MRREPLLSLTAEAAQRRLVALGMPQERARVAAAMSEGCVGQALTVGEETLQARRELTGRIFGVRRAADIPAVTALYKDEKLDKQAVLIELESAVRDILAAQATGSPLEAAANAPEAQAYASSVHSGMRKPRQGNSAAKMTCWSRCRSLSASSPR